MIELLVSAAIITKNEARCIERCLSSIVSAVDEIVIVDTGSKDSTKEIIENFRKGCNNIKLYDLEWKDDFSHARNFSISKTRGKFVFIIDADEFLHEGDITLVKETCMKLVKIGGSIIAEIELLNIQNFELSSIINTGITRIISRNIRYAGKIHEQPDFLKVDKVKLVKTAIRLFHDGYDDTVINRIDKTKRNIKMLEREMKENPENPWYYLYFSREIIDINPNLAISYLYESINRSENWPENKQLISFINITVNEYKQRGIIIKGLTVVESEQ